MLIVFFILASFTQLYSAIAEQDVPLSLAKLGWYLPLSPGNYEFQGVTQDSRYIFVTDQRSFSGIDIDTGAYTFNTTFQDKILCSKLVENSETF